MMKGVESLPLRYVILALVAILVVGLVIEINNSTVNNVHAISGKMTEEIDKQMNSQFDTTPPQIYTISSYHTWKDGAEVSCIKTSLKDDSGIKLVVAYMNSGKLYLHKSGTNNDKEIWEGCFNSRLYGSYRVTIFAMDNSIHDNKDTKTVNLNFT